MSQTFSHEIAQSTPTGNAIAQLVSEQYALGDVQECTLLRRGFNHVYGLCFVDGQRAVARLSAERPRGAPNTNYEAALLAHLNAAGAAVANTLPTRNGDAAIKMALPEGERPLMLFEHLDGEPPGDSLADLEATGRGLALLHEAGQDFDSSASLYRLELPHLLSEPLERVLKASTMDDALRPKFASIAQRLEERITAMPELTRVMCHGDCHGQNNFMTDGPDGTRVASFFDFDDTGPGLLAYELTVYLWALLPRKVGGELDAKALECWRRYIAGYRSVRPIGSADFDAIAAFLAVRQFWAMGESAGRTAVWGTQAMPTSWLRKCVDIMVEWTSLKTPE